MADDPGGGRGQSISEVHVMDTTPLANDEHPNINVPDNSGVCETNSNQLVNDGLLCCILKAISSFGNNSELVAAVGRVTSEAEVKTSWVKLFNYIDNAYDESRKMKIKDIKRQSKKIMLDDIVAQLRKKELCGDFHNFVLPWFYTIKDFKSDSEMMSDAFTQETRKES